MDQRQRIIETSMQMFVEQGVKAVRMDDIAHKLSMSKRTLYQMFGNKDELLYLAIEFYFQLKANRRGEITRQTSNILEAIFAILNDELIGAHRTEFVMDGIKRFYPEVAERLQHMGNEKSEEELQYCIRQGISEGLFLDTINADLAIMVLKTSTRAIFCDSKTQLPNNISPSDAFMQVITGFFRGISTAEGMKFIDSFATHPIKVDVPNNYFE